MDHRILIADDEQEIRKLVASNLKRAGFTVFEAADAGDALEVVRRDAPTLIVLDWLLPGMSGLELCRLLRGSERTRNISIIMLSAKAQETDRIAGLENGADDYVTKPFSPRELVLRIQSLLRRVAIWNEGECACRNSEAVQAELPLKALA